MKIHLWCAGVFAQGGGIEAHTQAFLATLRDEFGDDRISVFAKHETRSALRKKLASLRTVGGTGSIPLRVRTPAFTALITGKALLDRPDLIVSMHLNFCPAADWLKRGLGIPYAVSLHGVEAWGLTNRGRRRALARADLKLPISEFTQRRVVAEQNLSPSTFRLLPCTFDAAQFTPAAKPEYLLQRYCLTPSQPVILTVARLAAHEAYKGQDRILRVLSEVKSQISNVRYLIVGDGNDRPRLERQAAEQGISELVKFCGRVPPEELADHYRLCDMFAMPSMAEGFGIVFLEALACGKPVIGGTRDAAVDALRHGELGVLVDPKDPAELRDAIVSILTKTNAHPLIFQPDLLRKKVIEYFGFDKFRETLGGHLKEFFSRA